MAPVSLPALTILDAAVEQERMAWIQAWEAWPQREPMVHPAYAEAFLAPNERLVLALGQEVFLPLVVRPLANGLCDLTTPYGYGGPYGSTEGSFWDEFEAWAASIGAVTLFARLPLFDAAPFRGETVETMPNVAVDLTGSTEERWLGFEHKVRKNVKKAQTSGLTVEIDPIGERLDDFLRIYEKTMDRRDATAGYRFGREFFQKLIQEIPDSVCFFHVLAEGEVVSTELVLHSRDNVYSFLGGTDEAWFASRPNDLLKHAVIEWAALAGKRRFVLGGGYRPDDGILRYKRGFAPEGLVSFYVGRRTFDTTAVVALVSERRVKEPDWSPAEGFFPAYRAPKAVAA